VFEWAEDPVERGEVAAGSGEEAAPYTDAVPSGEAAPYADAAPAEEAASGE
jgi:hypothetical protein